MGLILILGVFIPIYDTYLINEEGSNKLSDFITDQEKIEHYLYGGAASENNLSNFDDSRGGVKSPFEGVEDRVGRVDSILLPIKLLSRDPVKLISGLGMGNVSESFIEEFSGKYAVYSEYYGANVSVISLLLWELGIIGVVLALISLLFVVRDAYILSKAQDFSATFGLGWIAVVLIMIVAMPYKNLIHFNVLGYLFWYFSGYVAVQRLRADEKRIQEKVSSFSR
jgi:hypothetical protein